MVIFSQRTEKNKHGKTRETTEKQTKTKENRGNMEKRGKQRKTRKNKENQGKIYIEKHGKTGRIRGKH